VRRKQWQCVGVLTVEVWQHMLDASKMLVCGSLETATNNVCVLLFQCLIQKSHSHLHVQDELHTYIFCPCCFFCGKCIFYLVTNLTHLSSPELGLQMYLEPKIIGLRSQLTTSVTVLDVLRLTRDADG
jgi:hypothetical protein